MCDYCGDMDRKHVSKHPEPKRKLEEGVVGSRIIKWFKENEYAALPVDAEMLTMHSLHEVDYRITFEDGTVADCKLIFDKLPHVYADVISCEEFNRVI